MPSPKEKEKNVEEKILPFTLGADPEFNLIAGQKRLGASGFLPILLGNKFPQETMGYRIGNAGNIGWDGNSATGEVRPMYSKKPKDVVENLRTCFMTLQEVNGLVTVSTKSDLGPVGGHVHFGVRSKLSSRGDIERAHRILSTFGAPIVLSEDPINIATRVHNGFGTLSDFRDDHSNTYEMRWPTAEWITTPHIAEATLSYLGVVMAEILENPERFRGNLKGMISASMQQANGLQSILVSQSEFWKGPIMKAIKSNIRQFKYYPLFKEEVEFILNPAKVKAEKEKVNYDIMKGWKIQGNDGKAPSLKTLTSEKALKAAIEKHDLDALTKFVNIAYNDDHNVASMVKDLMSRIAAFGWKTKNSYGIFGLKKGVKNPIVVNRNREFLMGDEMILTTDDWLTFSDRVRSMDARMFPNYVMDNNGGRREILIGLPYEMRTKNDMKNLVALIHDIEEGHGTKKENWKKIDEKKLKKLPEGEKHSPESLHIIYTQKTTDESALTKS